MIDIIISTHGNLGQAYINSAEAILGKKQNLHFIGLHPSDGIENLEESLSALPFSKEKLCLVDIPGGSPSRAIMEKFAEDHGAEIISGINLEMLLTAIKSRDNCDCHTLSKRVIKMANDSIKELK